MFEVLRQRTYRHLFLAQVVALVGTGLATVALGLLAFRLAGKEAGTVLGTALAIKMLAYVVIAPIAGAYAGRVPRRSLLVSLDIVRLLVVLALPWVDQIWQVYVLIFVLQSASAAFTPTFQATIPEVLPREEDYTKALSLARLAYDLESLLSPALAAVLLTVTTDQGLFMGTAVGFLGSALLVVSVALPRPAAQSGAAGVTRRLTRGMRIYLATPRLRGLLALNLAAAAGGAMVIVNTVVIVRGELQKSAHAVALALAAFGAGSMLMAFALPRLLERYRDRSVMLAAAAMAAALLAGLALAWSQAQSAHWPILLAGWLLLGTSYAALVTPGGRLLRRSSQEEDRPALFSAQFSLSHACWLLTYPLVGWLGAQLGIGTALWVMAAIAALGWAAAARSWPRDESESLQHRHDDLPQDHPHLATGEAVGGGHRHPYVIDDLHPRWPS
ncbi:MAG TPA: MFS transporter [Solimonas sp.]|nr:MFS transporter [Solimonas sp.]